MSQGLTWIAARRMPLVALVALLALTVGMFVALAPARAHDLGGCSNPEYLTQAACEIADVDDDDDSTTDAVARGTWDPGTHSTANHPPTLTISFTDSDAVVGGGTSLTVDVTSSGIFAQAPSNPGAAGSPAGLISLGWVRISGELSDPVQTATELSLDATTSTTDEPSNTTARFTVIVPLARPRATTPFQRSSETATPSTSITMVTRSQTRSRRRCSPLVMLVPASATWSCH